MLRQRVKQRSGPDVFRGLGFVHLDLDVLASHADPLHIALAVAQCPAHQAKIHTVVSSMQVEVGYSLFAHILVLICLITCLFCVCPGCICSLHFVLQDGAAGASGADDSMFRSSSKLHHSTSSISDTDNNYNTAVGAAVGAAVGGGSSSSSSSNGGSAAPRSADIYPVVESAEEVLVESISPVAVYICV